MARWGDVPVPLLPAPTEGLWGWEGGAAPGGALCRQLLASTPARATWGPFRRPAPDLGALSLTAG